VTVAATFAPATSTKSTASAVVIMLEHDLERRKILEQARKDAVV
jgi:hypothetical protein